MDYIIPPLRKRTEKGVLYARPVEIEKIIAGTMELPFEEFIKRAKHKNRNHPDYLPSEVLVHRIRATRHNNTDEQFNALYSELYARVIRSCASAVTRAGGKTREIGKLLDVREFVIERFVTLVVKDRDSYIEKLDIFEVRFDRAVMMLRMSAFRKMSKRDNPIGPLEYDESGDVPLDVEESLAILNPQLMTPEEEVTYRYKVRRAIDSLPETERRVIDMLEAGIPIESKNSVEPSIAGILGCTPKTVRNRRNRAVQRIREILGLEICNA